MEVGFVAQVQAHDMTGVRDDADEGGWLADTLFLGTADLFDEVLGEQPSHEIGHGHAGEVGGAGELGAALWAAAEELVEDEAAVVAPGVLREELAVRGARAAPASMIVTPRHVC